MFTFKRGPFKEETPLNNGYHSRDKRTSFMSQMSKIEFDLMNQKVGEEKLLTIYEFDKKRSSLQSQDTIEEII